MKNLWLMHLLFGVLSCLAFAHHSFDAEFDAKQPITLTGVIEKVEWINPHTWFHIVVKDADGTSVKWMVEGGPPNALTLRGFKKSSIPVGTPIKVNGYRAKDGTNRAAGANLETLDGKKLFVGTSNSNGQEEQK